MYKTAKELGLTPDEINKIAEELWREENDYFRRSCPDCDVDIDEKHLIECDVARCTKCGGQYISCNCENNDVDVWTGIWPGQKECYEQKLICTSNNGLSWLFDINSYYKNLK